MIVVVPPMKALPTFAKPPKFTREPTVTSSTSALKSLESIPKLPTKLCQPSAETLVVPCI